MTHISTDQSNLQGELSIFIRPEGSEDKFLVYKGKNRITNMARKYLLDMVTDLSASLTPNPITKFRVGTGGGVTQTLDGTETDLFARVEPVVATPTEYTGAVTFTFSDAPDNMVAEYAFEIASTELNPPGFTLPINEVGLFCDNDWYGNAANGNMFNIKLFPDINKSSSFAVVFLWRINFSGAC